MNLLNRSRCRRRMGDLEVSSELLDRLEREVGDLLDGARKAAKADGATRALPGHLGRAK